MSRALLLAFAAVTTLSLSGCFLYGPLDEEAPAARQQVGSSMPAPAAAPLPEGPDSDNDGVPDSLDRCPNTRPGTLVDRVGCPVIPPPMPATR